MLGASRSSVAAVGTHGALPPPCCTGHNQRASGGRCWWAGAPRVSLPHKCHRWWLCVPQPHAPTACPAPLSPRCVPRSCPAPVPTSQPFPCCAPRASQRRRSETLKEPLALQHRGFYSPRTCDTGLAFPSQVLLSPIDLHSCDLLAQQKFSRCVPCLPCSSALWGMCNLPRNAEALPFVPFPY